jgi:hypothetical protein
LRAVVRAVVAPYQVLDLAQPRGRHELLHAILGEKGVVIAVVSFRLLVPDARPSHPGALSELAEVVE